jgi:hypothetical protein
MLRGQDEKTLFMMVAQWQGIKNMGALFHSRTARRMSVQHWCRQDYKDRLELPTQDLS